ncbi:putative bifunctional diguanylate cyclase/phosphodiesterase [Pararhodospirillum oryzae]|uniref:GGDEF domain-containing protein n=1 Tax=Pararhodospirillum oryzae TaxID=478448 RepID=A0A512H5A4_9PROT|nr:bifunctional diguanylate cyclase/phosphodiesterase [Pararhodospirillum oryzae]GEO80594.1 hypothetical protein ROR02_07250 [Pararhodospirillum oryzae]
MAMRLIAVFVVLGGLAAWVIGDQASRREAERLTSQARILETGVTAVVEGVASNNRLLHGLLAKDPETVERIKALVALGGGTPFERAPLLQATVDQYRDLLAQGHLHGLCVRDPTGTLIAHLPRSDWPPEQGSAETLEDIPATIPLDLIERVRETGPAWGMVLTGNRVVYRLTSAVQQAGRPVAILETVVSASALIKALAQGMPGWTFDIVTSGALARQDAGPASLAFGTEGESGFMAAARGVDQALGAVDPARLKAGLDSRQSFALASWVGDTAVVLALRPLIDMDGQVLAYAVGAWPSREGQTLRAIALAALAGTEGLLLALCLLTLHLRRIWQRAEEGRRQLLTITDTMSEALYVVDGGNRIVFVNATCRRLLGYPEEEMRGAFAHALFSGRVRADKGPRAVGIALGPLESAVLERRPLAPTLMSFLRQDGTSLMVEVRCNPLNALAEPTTPVSACFARLARVALGWDPARAPFRGPAAVVTFVDVSERARRESALLKLSRAVEQSSASVIITDASGVIEYVNPAFSRISGYAAEEVLGQRPSVLKSGRVAPEVYRDLWETLRAGREWRGEFHNRRKNGSLYWEQATISPVKNEAGEITHYVAVKDDVTEKKEIEEELFHRANYDALTGLPNRQLLMDRLNTALAVARRESLRVAVMFMDLDRFKQINDSRGHNAGDVLLKQAASRLSAVLRPQDTLGRLGGDEFLVVAPGLHKESEAVTIAGRLLDVARQPFTVDEREVYVTTSIGVSLGPADGQTPQVLMRNADAAMYQAKEQGRDRYHFFTPEVEAASLRRMALEGGLRHAVREGGFSLVFQPIFSSDGTAMTKAEALLRWTHPELGPVSPAEFIDVAEETGQIVAIGSWVLEEACRALVALDPPRDGRFRLGVNVSSRQFSADLVGKIQELLDHHDLDPRMLEIEITERLLLHPSSEVHDQLETLRAMGISIAIDDFGTGYSALSYLNAFRIDTLKIDRSFVMSMETDARARALVGAITRLAHTLEARVVAEGVETPEQANLLAALGVDSLQGFLLGRPMALEAIRGLLYRTGLPHEGPWTPPSGDLGTTSSSGDLETGETVARLEGPAAGGRIAFS